MQLRQKNLESCSNGLPKLISHNVMSLGEDVFLAFVCSGRGLPKEDKHLRGRVLHVTAVKGAISRKDSLDNKLLAKFLVNNPSSQEMTKKKDKLVHKYSKFIIFDSTRCKMIDDPGLALPHDPAPVLGNQLDGYTKVM